MYKVDKQSLNSLQGVNTARAGIVTKIIKGSSTNPSARLKNEERVKPDGKANKARWYSI